MMHHFLADLLETGIFGEVGYVTVHFTVHFYVFYHLFAVCFHAAIKIMQVFYAGNLTCGSVEQLGRYGF